MEDEEREIRKLGKGHGRRDLHCVDREEGPETQLARTASKVLTATACWAKAGA